MAEFSQGCVIILIAVVAGIAARAALIAYTWLWFIAPVFNLPVLTFTEAFGISMFTGVLLAPATAPWRTANEDDVKSFLGVAGRTFGVAVFVPLGVLALAWGWHTATMPGGFLAQWNVAPQ